MCDLAVVTFGMMAPVVFKQWNVRTTDDVGRMVFDLIGAGRLSKSDRDTPEDRRHREQRQREDGGDVDQRHGGEPGRDAGRLHPSGHQQPVLQGRADRVATREEPADRVPGELRRADQEVPAGPQAQTDQRPDAEEARRLQGNHHEEPRRVHVAQFLEGAEDRDQRRPHDVEADQGDEQRDEPAGRDHTGPGRYAPGLGRVRHPARVPSRTLRRQRHRFRSIGP